MSAAIPTQRRRGSASDTWPRVRLGEVCEVVYGERIRKIDATAPTYPVYGGGGATFRWATFNRENACVVSRFAMSKECVRYVKGRFFLNDSGLTVASISKFLSQEFIDWFLMGSQTKIYACGQGVAQRNLEIKRFRNLSVPLPPLAIQRRIAAKLDLLCDIVAKRKNQLSQLNQLVKSRFVEMFGDVALDEHRLGDFCEVGSGKRVFAEEFKEQGVPFFRGTEIAALAKKEYSGPVYYIAREHYNQLAAHTGIPKIGDLLLPSICEEGLVWRVDIDKPFYFKDGRVLWVKVPQTVDSEYLRFALSEKLRTDYKKIASGTTFAEMKIVNLRQVKVKVPPLALQREFAAFVAKVDKLAFAVRKSLESAEKLYRQQLSEAFA